MEYDHPRFELRETPEFLRWRDELRDPRASVRIQARLYRLANGIWGDVKPVGSNVMELRIDYGPGYRVYFTRRGPGVILLLTGGDIGTQRRDIPRALRLARLV